MLLTDVCAGFICWCYGRCWEWYILGTLGAPWSLVHLGGAGFAGFSLMYTGLGLRRCAYRWTRPLGGGRWEHYLRGHRGVHWCAEKCASCFQVVGSDSIVEMLCMPALAGLRHPGENAGKRYVRPSFPRIWFFCLVGTLYGGVRFSGIFVLVGLGTLTHPTVG